MLTWSRRKQGRKVLYISNKIKCDTVNSNVNRNKSNHLNASNSDNVIGITVHLYTHYFEKVTYIDSSGSINISEDISSHQNSAEIIHHTCDDNGINLLNTEE